MNGIFSGVRERWLPLYRLLHAMTTRMVGEFEEHMTSGAVVWRHSSAFAEISARKDCMVVGVVSDAPHEEWNPAKTAQTSKNRITHYFEVTDDSLFPVLAERIAASYALTSMSRSRKPDAEKPVYNTIDEYIARFPAEVQAVLCEVRGAIRRAAPDAAEKISWQMPTFWQNGNLVHFAAAKNHIGFYPGESGVRVFGDTLTEYKTSKGAIQFPLDKPIPVALVEEITRFRVKENTAEQQE